MFFHGHLRSKGVGRLARILLGIFTNLSSSYQGGFSDEEVQQTFKWSVRTNEFRVVPAPRIIRKIQLFAEKSTPCES
jgi:hypothetical protein